MTSAKTKKKKIIFGKFPNLISTFFFSDVLTSVRKRDESFTEHRKK